MEDGEIFLFTGCYIISSRDMNVLCKVLHGLEFLIGNLTTLVITIFSSVSWRLKSQDYNTLMHTTFISITMFFTYKIVCCGKSYVIFMESYVQKTIMNKIIIQGRMLQLLSVGL